MIDAWTIFKHTHYVPHIYYAHMALSYFSASFYPYILVLLVPPILLHACVHQQHMTITIAHT